MNAVYWTMLAALASPDERSLRLELDTSASGTVPAVVAELRWLGDDRTLALRDDGITPDEAAGDGVWTAETSGPAPRVLPVTLRVQTAGGSWQPAYSGLERLSGTAADGPATLHWALQIAQPPQARRLSGPGSRDTVDARSSRRIAAGLAWVALMVLGIALWWRHGARRPAAPVALGWAPSTALWAAVAVAWTWPAAASLALGEPAVGRHFDLPGTLWTLEALPRMLPSLTDPLTAWPEGGQYQRLDSFTLLPIAVALQWLGAVRLHSLLQLVGIVLTGLSGQWMARQLGARAPWGLLSGLLLALSGLAANALLEGHVYLILCPFLPVLIVSWRAALRPGATVGPGVVAGLAFSATLLTSGYLGLSGAAVVLGLLAASLPRVHRLSWPPLLGAAAVVAVVGGLWSLSLTASSGLPTDDPQAVQLASAHLAALGWATPEVDRAEHSLSLGLSGVMLGLALLAPVALRRGQRWGDLALAGLGALLLAMGPALATGPHGSLLPLPLGWLSGTGIGGLVRFPARLGWGALVCLAPLAALVGSALEQRHGPRTRLVIGIVLMEAVLAVGLPWRQTTLSTAAPSAYAQSSGPVLDLFPEGIDSGGELESWSTALACLYQLSHGQVIADDCVATPVDAGPRHRLGRWVHARLLEGDGAAVQQQLEALGFGGLAVHLDWYDPATRARLVHALGALPEPVQSHDGGEHLLLHPLQPAAAPAALPATLSARSRALGGPGLAPPPEVVALRTELIVPVADPSRRYRLRFTGAGGSWERDVQNRGEAPDDLPGDRVWVDWWEQVPAVDAVELLVVDTEGEHSAWSGPLRLGAVHERLVFRQLDGDPRSFRPVAAAPDMRNQPANRSVGTAAARGWLGVLLVALFSGWLVRRR